MASCFFITDLLRNYLLVSTCNLEQTWNLRTHVINLLTNMPSETYKELIIPIQEHIKVPTNLQYVGYNMTALYEILMFLSAKFNDEMVSEIISTIYSLRFIIIIYNNIKRIIVTFNNINKILYLQGPVP